MIGSDDDRALLRRRQRVEQPPDGVVHDRHLGQVGVTAGPLEERARSFVRRVGIEEVHPEEEAVVDPATREPREGSIDRLIGAALEHVLPGGLLATGGAVEDLEALIQAEGPVHHGRGDERGGAAAGVEGRLGERPRLVGERRQPVVPQPVPRREEAGEHRRVRGQSERGDGPRRVEDLRLAAERSKARRDPSILPVEIERARVGRVEGHEHERAGAAEGRAAHVVPSASAQPEAGERTRAHDEEERTSGHGPSLPGCCSFPGGVDDVLVHAETDELVPEDARDPGVARANADVRAREQYALSATTDVKRHDTPPMSLGARGELRLTHGEHARCDARFTVTTQRAAALDRTASSRRRFECTKPIPPTEDHEQDRASDGLLDGHDASAQTPKRPQYASTAVRCSSSTSVAAVLARSRRRRIRRILEQCGGG